LISFAFFPHIAYSLFALAKLAIKAQAASVNMGDIQYKTLEEEVLESFHQLNRTIILLNMLPTHFKNLSGY
jgi:hypothetical protein